MNNKITKEGATLLLNFVREALSLLPNLKIEKIGISQSDKTMSTLSKSEEDGLLLEFKNLIGIDNVL